jgi:hypothetical protein
MDTTAMSKGKKTRTNTTPRMYQTTPFIDFFKKTKSAENGGILTK